MFCVYTGGTAAPFKGELKNSSGTFPAAWLRAATPATLAAMDVYQFEDQSRSYGEKQFYFIFERKHFLYS